MKKLNNIILKTFSIGVVLCLFAGGLSVLGYIVAMMLGGEKAGMLCEFIFTQYLPWVIRLTSAFSGIGLIGMYLSKEKALTVKAEKRK